MRCRSPHSIPNFLWVGVVRRRSPAKQISVKVPCSTTFSQQDPDVATLFQVILISHASQADQIYPGLNVINHVPVWIQNTHPHRVMKIYVYTPMEVLSCGSASFNASAIAAAQATIMFQSRKSPIGFLTRLLTAHFSM